jgi:hypothetical protein
VYDSAFKMTYDSVYDFVHKVASNLIFNRCFPTCVDRAGVIVIGVLRIIKTLNYWYVNRARNPTPTCTRICTRVDDPQSSKQIAK